MRSDKYLINSCTIKVHVGQNFYRKCPDKILHDKDFDQHLIRTYTMKIPESLGSLSLSLSFSLSLSLSLSLALLKHCSCTIATCLRVSASTSKTEDFQTNDQSPLKFVRLTVIYNSHIQARSKTNICESRQIN